MRCPSKDRSHSWNPKPNHCVATIASIVARAGRKKQRRKHVVALTLYVTDRCAGDRKLARRRVVVRERRDRVRLDSGIEARQEVSHERLVAKRLLALRFRFGAKLLFLRRKRCVSGFADFERQQQLAARGRLERGLELVGVSLVGKMLVRRGQRKRESVSGQRLQF